MMSAFMHIRAQEIIIQPPIFTPFECTDFFQLYTGTITNFSSQAFSTQLFLEVDYTNPNGQTRRLAEGVLKGLPSTVFQPGITVINNATFESIYPDRQITFTDMAIENLLVRSKCLPPGQYDVCLTLYDINATPGAGDFLTQTCYTREKQMFSPLLLVSPFEEDTVFVQLPLFTWTPVTPLFSSSKYKPLHNS